MILVTLSLKVFEKVHKKRPRQRCHLY